MWLWMYVRVGVCSGGFDAVVAHPRFPFFKARDWLKRASLGSIQRENLRDKSTFTVIYSNDFSSDRDFLPQYLG